MTIESSKPDLQNPIAFKEAALIYVYCLIAMIAGFTLLPWLLRMIDLNFFAFLLSLIIYIACGIFMNFKVLRRMVEWHQIYDTLPNVAREKVAYILVWPLKYLFLFFQIAVVKYL